MAVVTLEAGRWLKNSAVVPDAELFMHSLIGSHGHCSHSHMSTNICIYSMWIKISILWTWTNTHTHIVCRMSCWAMQLCSLQTDSRHLLDHIRKHREWVNKYVLPKIHLPLHSGIQQTRISRKKVCSWILCYQPAVISDLLRLLLCLIFWNFLRIMETVWQTQWNSLFMLIDYDLQYWKKWLQLKQSWMDEQLYRI